MGGRAGADLEALIWDVFLDKLQNLKPEEENKLREAVSPGNGQMIVRSVFPLPDEKLARLQQRLAERYSAGISLSHENKPDLICGLELDAGGYRLGWSVDSYLAGVEERILGILDQAEEAGS